MKFSLSLLKLKNSFLVGMHETEQNDADLDTWLEGMFEIIDNVSSSAPVAPGFHQAIPYPSPTFHQDKRNGFLPLSIPEHIEILETLKLFSTLSADQHLLLDTSAPRSICSIKLLQKTHWTALKKIGLPDTTPPFRFAGNPVSALYDVQLVASLTEIQGKKHELKLSIYVLPPIPIPFLLESTESRRLGLKIGLCEQHASHLRISA